MHICEHAKNSPDRPAIIMAESGECVTFAELETASNRGAHLLRQHGLRPGDVVALWSANNARYLEIVWTIQRSGLCLVLVQAKLNAEEAGYIINDCCARVVIVDAAIGSTAAQLSERRAELCPTASAFFSLRGLLPQSLRWEEATASMSAIPIPDPSPGRFMHYSSGTTGKPKGIVMPQPPHEAFDAPNAFAQFHGKWLQVEPGTRWLVTSPLYHSGPLNMTMAEHRLGSTAIIFEKFDAESVLAGIAKYGVERAQFVPTMFTRMLKLPPDLRLRHDVSSLKAVIHSGGPCPVEVKRQMIEWWGPVLYELYGSTESAGTTAIDSHQWLKKPGSVGLSLRNGIHICADDGTELPIGATGIVYFDGNAPFSYHNDPTKTAAARHPLRSDWSTQGDIGRLDHDGYLYLTDRLSFMIISGGVNIYPQEVEDILIIHPAVADVAVFGIPDADMGEQVKALVQPAAGYRASPELAAELMVYCRSKLASYKCPKSVDFDPVLPRDAMGKMMKRHLRDRYWQKKIEALPVASIQD